MKKICFGNGLTAVNGNMCNLTNSTSGKKIEKVYRFPNDLINISNVFNECINLCNIKGEIPVSALEGMAPENESEGGKDS